MMLPELTFLITAASLLIVTFLLAYGLALRSPIGARHETSIHESFDQRSIRRSTTRRTRRVEAADRKEVVREEGGVVAFRVA